MELPASSSPAHLFPRVAELGSVEEDWTGISSQAKRRRLQNRLNQRARRRRLLDPDQPGLHSQRSTTTARDKPDRTEEIEIEIEVHSRSRSRSRSRSLASSSNNVQVTTTTTSTKQRENRYCRPEQRALLLEFVAQATRAYHMGTPNLIHLADTVRSNIFLALAHNIRILGFDDTWLQYDAISPFNEQRTGTGTGPGPGPGPGPQHWLSSSSNYPANMRPTYLQTIVEHHPWIDLFPCPRMRDNFLKAVLTHGEDAVDEDNLCNDAVEAGIAVGPDATTIIAWTDPWSPNGWEVTEMFIEKWGWLLHGCVEMQAGTNAWRKRRGLERLQFPGC